MNLESGIGDAVPRQGLSPGEVLASADAGLRWLQPGALAGAAGAADQGSWRGRSAISPHRAKEATRKAFTTTMRRRSWFACCRCARGAGLLRYAPSARAFASLSGAAGAESGKSPAGRASRRGRSIQQNASVVTTPARPSRRSGRGDACVARRTAHLAGPAAHRRGRPEPPGLGMSAERPGIHLQQICPAIAGKGLKLRLRRASIGTTTRQTLEPSRRGRPRRPVWGHWPATGCADCVGDRRSSSRRPTWTGRRWLPRCAGPRRPPRRIRLTGSPSRSTA
ncbi:hypothetical protein ACPA9J_16450 [Pseudomonas aeruginosa]